MHGRVNGRKEGREGRMDEKGEKIEERKDGRKERQRAWGVPGLCL
jgi:hypothetical protein